jgi:short-subunit dehydrogenase
VRRAWAAVPSELDADVDSIRVSLVVGSAVVTGASSGLGLELARLLAQRGERVVAVARNSHALNDLVATSPRIEPVVADLSTREGREHLYAAIDDVDILVNSAGFGSGGLFSETPGDVSDRMVEVNVVALTDLTAHWLPGMVQRRSGRVLNVASTAAFQPGPTMAVYYATKAYVLSFTEGIAEELRGTGVTATAFCPGAFASGFQATAGIEESRLLKGRILPTSSDMARAALDAMDRGKVVAVPGLLNKVGAVGPRFAPRPLIRRAVRWIQSAA